MLKVDVILNKGQFGVKPRTNYRQAVLLSAIQDFEPRLTRRMFHPFQGSTDERSNPHLVVCESFVAWTAKTQEFKQLHVGARCMPAKVERHRVALATQITHADRNMLRKIGALAEYKPPRSANGLAELVSRSRNGQDAGKTKVKGRHSILEWGDEAATRSIDMNSNLPPLLLVQFGDESINFPNFVVGAIVVIAEDTHDSNGLFVDQIDHFLGIDSEGRNTRLHELGRDIEVLE
jgi:hypothetical protein